MLSVFCAIPVSLLLKYIKQNKIKKSLFYGTFHVLVLSGLDYCSVLYLGVSLKFIWQMLALSFQPTFFNTMCAVLYIKIRNILLALEKFIIQQGSAFKLISHHRIINSHKKYDLLTEF